MERWTRPGSYMGPDWPDYYVFLGQHRDSDSVSRSNFTVGLRELGGESETVLVIRDSHWAVGWVETILIHQSDAKAIAAAQEMESALSDYPVLSDDHLSELEWNEACEYWERMSVRDRVDTIRSSRCGASIFAARRAALPQDDNGSLMDELRG